MATWTTPHDPKPLAELSDRELRERPGHANRAITEIDAADPAAIVRSGRADETLARLEAAIDTVQEAEAELAEHAHHSLPERLPRSRTLERGKRKPHPAAKWLDAARRFSVPELVGERLAADRLSEEDAAAWSAS